MVTHERALAERYANRIVTMADGRIAARSTANRATTRIQRSGRPRSGRERDAAMKLRDLSELAARNLREAVLRNSLTTAGHCRRRCVAGGHALAGQSACRSSWAGDSSAAACLTACWCGRSGESEGRGQASDRLPRQWANGGQRPPPQFDASRVPRRSRAPGTGASFRT